MACYFHFFLLSALFLIYFSNAQRSFGPKALVLPVTKDAKSLQYVTNINQRTPLVPVKLVVDLGGRFTWVACDDVYISSSYRTTQCGSAQCKLAKSDRCDDCLSSSPSPSSPWPGCINNTCGDNRIENIFTDTFTNGGLIEDLLSLQSTDGSNPGPVVTVPRALLYCTYNFLIQGLVGGARGMASLGRSRISLPSQLATAFSFRRKFALCLSSSTSSNGAIFIGNGPYVMLPGTDVSKSLTYTPLILNPVRWFGRGFVRQPSPEYFIGVKSIKVNNKKISFSSSLLAINRKGVGGTKISTTVAHTTLVTPIHKALTKAFISWAKSSNIELVVPPVKPFDLCFSSKNIGSTRVGPAVPTIDLVLPGENLSWKIFGANSMVPVSEGVLCLGFLDGGSMKPATPLTITPTASIVIGGYQLEDNLLEFDLDASRVGFSSSLLFRQTTCANFNFTSNA